MSYDRLAEAERNGRKAALNHEDIKQYTDLMKSPQERAVFTQGYYLGLQELRDKREKKCREEKDD